MAGRLQGATGRGLRSGLAVWVYSLPVGTMAGVAHDISDQVERLTFSTVAPGGYGTLSARVRLRNSRIPRPELAAFAFICVKAGAQVIWLGEQMTPGLGYSQREGEYITLNALGIGNCLRDNAGNWSYTSSTAQAIARAQLTQHTSTQKDLAANLSTDNSQLFPDNPSLAISQVYVARTMEEIIADVAFLAGDYNWGVEADPRQANALGFPLGRVYARARDLSTVGAMALLAQGDISQLDLTPNADRAYNSIEIDYLNGTSGLGTTTATDSRLASDLSQGSAPFRYRRYARDLSTYTTVTSGMANQIASTYLNLYKNITYAGRGTILRVRDQNAQTMPLYLLQAGMNLALPESTLSIGQLYGSPPSASGLSSPYVQGSNLFWVSQATYREDTTGLQTVDVQLGYLPDDAGIQIARLQMAADAKARAGNKTIANVQAPGASMNGYFALGWSNGVSGQNVNVGVTYPAIAANVPTSLSLSVTASGGVTLPLVVNYINALGANIVGTLSAAGSGYFVGTYKTNGNCLLAVDATARTFDQHCDHCDTVNSGRNLDVDLVVDTSGGTAPGGAMLYTTCPACGATESYNTALAAAAESDPFPPRAEQARLIRAAMVARGMTLLA